MFFQCNLVHFLLKNFLILNRNPFANSRKCFDKIKINWLIFGQLLNFGKINFFFIFLHFLSAINRITSMQFLNHFWNLCCHQICALFQSCLQQIPAYSQSLSDNCWPQRKTKYPLKSLKPKLKLYNLLISIKVNLNFMWKALELILESFSFS